MKSRIARATARQLGWLADLAGWRTPPAGGPGQFDRAVFVSKENSGTSPMFVRRDSL